MLSQRSSVVQCIKKRKLFRANQEIIRHNSQEQYQNIPVFQDVNTSVTASKKKKKSMRLQQDTELYILPKSEYTVQNIFRYDLIPTSYLYDEDGLIKKPSKSAYDIK